MAPNDLLPMLAKIVLYAFHDISVDGLGSEEETLRARLTGLYAGICGAKRFLEDEGAIAEHEKEALIVLVPEIARVLRTQMTADLRLMEKGSHVRQYVTRA